MSSTDKKEWRVNVVNNADRKELHPLSPPEESYLTQLSSFGNFNSSGRLRHSSEVSHSGGSDNDVEDNTYSVVGTVSRLVSDLKIWNTPASIFFNIVESIRS